MLNENVYVWITSYNTLILNNWSNKQLNCSYTIIKKLISSQSMNVYNNIQNAIILKMIEYRLRYS